MKYLFPLYLITGITLLYPSTLSVYQDKTFYTYTSKKTFIGLTKNISARCEKKQVTLENTFQCPSNEQICKLFQEAEKLDKSILSNTANSKILEQLISLPQPDTIDAALWISAAREIGKEETRLSLEKKRLTHEKKRLKHLFAKRTRASMPLSLVQTCKGVLELTLPYGYISFNIMYEADISDKNVRITQKLSILNHSGIDIKAEEAYFYYREAQQYVNPVHFTPWIVGEMKNYRSKKQAKRTMNKSLSAEDTMFLESAVAPAPARAEYTDAREYKIKALDLPSTGEPLEVPVVRWEVPVTCELELYPYRSINTFEVCRFTPKYQIELNRWKVTDHGKMVNERATGEYDKNVYKLYTQTDQDIKVTRKPIVQKERETGIFGGTARKRDGFVLTLINTSDKKKVLKITERIPVSNTEKIKVKLLSVHGSKAVNYNLLKEGELKMNVVLAPNETQKIEVLFEISYDKDLKIDY